MLALTLLLACSGPPDGGDTDETGLTADTGHCETADTGPSWPEPDGLADLVPLPLSTVWFDQVDVLPSSCAFAEGCVGGVGRRLVLRFDTAVHNQGEHDLQVGRPQQHFHDFEYSVCHDHFHYAAFVDYALIDEGGQVVAAGHKQGFCLEDTELVESERTDVRTNERYGCGFQGLSAGWADIYGAELDCQWVDVTEVAPGDYTLRLTVNPEGTLPEATLDNNTLEMPVTVPVLDLDRACDGSDTPELNGDCGWGLAEVATCSVGEVVQVGCSEACGLGSCTGDPLLRVCAGQGADCLPGAALGNSDGCNSPCPRVAFSCPPEGSYTVWTADDGGVASTCALSTTTEAAPDRLSPCEGNESGSDRECGWGAALTGEPCNPGFEYWVGCETSACGLGLCSTDLDDHGLDAMSCEGDPVMRVCGGGSACAGFEALAVQDDNCGTECPAALFTCPAEGSFTVLTGPKEPWMEAGCEVGVVRTIDL